MALPYDLREMMYKGKPLWKRVIECILSLSEQVDALDGSDSSTGTTISTLTSKVTDLEARIEALESSGEGGE